MPRLSEFTRLHVLPVLGQFPQGPVGGSAVTHENSLK